MSKATVTQCGVLDMQVCVPKNWGNKEVIMFANVQNPCGTTQGWTIRQEGDPKLDGDSERQPCYAHPTNMVHIMLDA